MTDKTKGARPNPGPASPEILEAAVDNKTRKHSSRRGFIRGAIISAVAVTATAKLAKKTVSLLPEVDYQKAYLGDIEAGDRALKKTRITLMSEKEKKELLRMYAEDQGKSRS
ncbi:MAG: hypothetical protein ACE5EI_05515 [Thermodesulfobacteriota bacterium]